MSHKAKGDTGHVTSSGLGPKKFGVKSGLIQKRQEIFHIIICRKISFHPYLHF